LLKLVFKPETEAILAIEEPEAHLHPHASRSLAKNLHEIKGQKIISSHSPYFIQEIPFKDIRLFRRIGNSIKVLHLKEKFSIEIPANDKLNKFCKDHAPKYFHDGISLLTVYGKIDESEYKKLLRCCINQSNEDEIAKKVKKLFEESQSFIPDEDIPPLQTYIKRIRGEILFAKSWLLCEGQSECYLLPYFAELLGRPLDEFGISLIDFKNNGSAGSFPAVARVFEIPWIMICDTDPAGEGYKTEVKKRGFSDVEIQMRIKSYPETGLDIESFLIKNGFLPEYLELIASRNKSISRSSGDEGYEKEIVDIIQKDKLGYMLDLIDLLKRKGMDSSRIPPFFIDPINKITLNEEEHDH
jgi:putative ATP-dependent endonuclease of OLD family